MDRKIFVRSLTGTVAGLALAGLALPAMAQTLPYGSSGMGGGGGNGSRGGSDQSADETDSLGARPVAARRGVSIQPYIEAAQIVTAELAPGNDVISWSSIAAGVDVGLNGRNTQGSLSARYERRFGWGKAASGDAISGLARASVAIVPQAVAIEGGALATRTTVDGRSAGVPGEFGRKDTTNLYSAYIGPSVQTMAGDVALTGNYRIGYTEVGTSDTLRSTAAPANLDTFGHSVSHVANVRAAVRPGDVLPVGLAAGAGFLREDVSNLDQQVSDFHARGDVTVPVSSSVALVGGVGYEDVKISSRDVLRDAGGQPVRGADGRLVTNTAAPRQIAYQTSGLIWDAGITWRPSPRTALEAHVGRRYGSTTYYGSFGWRISSRSSFSLAVFDSLSGLGGRATASLVDLPTEFEALRNPTTGDLNGCVNPTGNAGTVPTGSNCLVGNFGSLRSAVFRSRGVQGNYATQIGRLGAGLSGGYERRRYIAGVGTILSSVNGVVDENAWLSAWLTGRLDQRSSFSTFVYGNRFRNGGVAGGKGTAIGANAILSHDFGYGFSGNASVGIQDLQRDALEDQVQANALLGLRYSFF
ncbi:preprotein translocase subunit YajC [Novosphingobium flavum]|uniref:Preprotein translocase subunit YajC n=1 Tax=Novosphingobium aerophilum TaxID=2839843 RepID=A0A7X1F5S2_9SPHN|nr:preprotein translocase subunit YajC [Novosphingobium aerophilum]MBC2650863.1 preprotein translocase subunit YajC [Novosphingobium aerophilum]MBC2661392.1 preprotein translocase subunit YajC [Novosphingobium aerophilum]